MKKVQSIIKEKAGPAYADRPFKLFKESIKRSQLQHQLQLI
jgi:hypothetical protein